MKEYLSIPPEVLEEFASEVKRYAEESEHTYFSCPTMEVEDRDITYAMIYKGVRHLRREVIENDYHSKVQYPLDAIVTTWCELHAFDEQGDEIATMFNSVDFSHQHLACL